MRAAKRAVLYLHTTRFDGLTFNCRMSHVPQGYADADFANQLSNRRSTSGRIIMLFGAAVMWSSRQHDDAPGRGTTVRQLVGKVCVCITLRDMGHSTVERETIETGGMEVRHSTFGRAHVTVGRVRQVSTQLVCYERNVWSTTVG